MEEKFKRERDEMKETAEAELKRPTKNTCQVETLQKARSPQKEEDETKRREREEEEKKKEETMIELRKEIERLKEELEKKPEEQPVIIETVVQRLLLLLRLETTKNSNSCAERAKNKAKLFNDWNEKLDP